MPVPVPVPVQCKCPATSASGFAHTVLHHSVLRCSVDAHANCVMLVLVVLESWRLGSRERCFCQAGAVGGRRTTTLGRILLPYCST